MKVMCFLALSMSHNKKKTRLGGTPDKVAQLAGALAHKP